MFNTKLRVRIETITSPERARREQINVFSLRDMASKGHHDRPDQHTSVVVINFFTTPCRRFLLRSASILFFSISLTILVSLSTPPTIPSPPIEPLCFPRRTAANLFGNKKLRAYPGETLVIEPAWPSPSTSYHKEEGKKTIKINRLWQKETIAWHIRQITDAKAHPLQRTRRLQSIYSLHHYDRRDITALCIHSSMHVKLNLKQNNAIQFLKSSFLLPPGSPRSFFLSSSHL